MKSEDVTRVIRTVVGDALEASQRVVLAVSGGIDSMVLLDAAVHGVPRQCLVATFDHGTGVAAARAARLVGRRANALGLHCVSARASGNLASEAEFRMARWAFLREVAKQFDASIATAHTEDDQIETVLHRVMRGAGARGMAGLYARSHIIRPLLGVRRRDVEAYAADVGLEWVEDPSNVTPRYMRNRIRHEILPVLRRVRPAIDEELLCTAREAAEWRDDVDAYIDQTLNVDVREHAVDVDVEGIRRHSPGELAILWPAIAARAGATLDRRGIARLAEFSASARTGSHIPLSGDWRVVRSRHTFQLRKAGQASESSSLHRIQAQTVQRG